MVTAFLIIFHNALYIFVFLLAINVTLTHSFLPQFISLSQERNKRSTSLFGGIGIAKDYSWKEEQFEIELKVPIPAETKQSDIIFKANLQSVHLSLRTNDGVINLVDGNRKMRGRIDIDGTFWSFSDSDHSGVELQGNKQRFVVITIEKLLSSSGTDQFDVVEYDWGGVYRDDENDVISKKYAEPEVLNVREYAASLGVDIDNIDMSKVDKNMFTSGLNMTRNTLDELCKMGYAKEVTRQYDGNEYILDNEDGENITFDPLGKGIGKEEIDEISEDKIKARSTESRAQVRMTDPIDLLSVERMREILCADGMKTDDSVGESELRASIKQRIKEKMSKRKDK